MDSEICDQRTHVVIDHYKYFVTTLHLCRASSRRTRLVRRGLMGPTMSPFERAPKKDCDFILHQWYDTKKRRGGLPDLALFLPPIRTCLQSEQCRLRTACQQQAPCMFSGTEDTQRNALEGRVMSGNVCFRGTPCMARRTSIVQAVPLSCTAASHSVDELITLHSK